MGDDLLVVPNNKNSLKNLQLSWIRTGKERLTFHLCLDPFTPLWHVIEKLSPNLQEYKMTFMFQ